MKRNKIITSIALTGIVLVGLTTSCRKDFFDINENPNFPSDVTVTELLPSAEAAIAHAVGNNFQIFGGLWGQYWTQNPSSSQYKTIEQYNPGANDFDNPWQILYSDAIQDLQTLIQKANAENKPNYVAVSKILQAYSFQLLTDNFGDVPFTEAARGNEGLTAPHYDSQQTVYNGIFRLLSEADQLINQADETTPGGEDFIFGGDLAYWQAFGNTLKLRAYLRLVYKDGALTQSGIAAMVDSGAYFLGAGEDAQLNYSSDPSKTNPLYSSMVGLSFIQNLVASSTAVDYMTNHGDPRLEVVYAPSTAETFVGIPQGAYDLPAGTLVAIPGAAVGGDAEDEASATAPVKLMTGFESLFLQAEAAVRGYLPGADAQALYEEAVAAGFQVYGVDDSTIATYLSQPDVAYPAGGSPEDQIKAIITQKWVAMNGIEGSESWTEWRRTGYPDFFVESVNSNIGGGRMPQRMLYPNVEVTRNENFPGQRLIYDKVWWDVN